jgi:hypothetical protein
MSQAAVSAERAFEQVKGMVARISVFHDRQQPCDADRVPAARAVRAANPKGFLFGRGAARLPPFLSPKYREDLRK